MAIKYPGTGNHFYSRTTNLSSITRFTMMAWCVPTSFPAQLCAVLSIGKNDGINSYSMGFDGTVSDLFYINNNTAIVSGSVTGVANVGYHVALTCAGTGSNLLLGYINGRLDITTTGSASVTAARMAIGVDEQISATSEFTGLISEVKIWNDVLELQEIKKEMLVIGPVRLANLNSYYPFINIASAPFDSSGNGRKLTLTGALTTSEMARIRAIKQFPVYGPKTFLQYRPMKPSSGAAVVGLEWMSPFIRQDFTPDVNMYGDSN